MTSDGGADPRLVRALAAHASEPSPARRAEVLAALAGAQVWVPVTARHRPRTEDGRSTGSETLLLTLVGSSGGRALPLFLDLAGAVAFRPGARPVPLPGPEACAGALDDGAVAVLLDPPGAALAVTGSELAELAAGRVPVAGAPLSAQRTSGALKAPQDVDHALLQSLAEALAGEPVCAARLLDGPDGPVLGVVPEGAPDPAALLALAGRVLPRVAHPGLAVAVVPPDGPGTPVPLQGPAPRPGRLSALRLRTRQGRGRQSS